MHRGRWLGVALSLVLSAQALGCSPGCTAKAVPDAGAGPVELTPLPPPAGHLGDLYLPTPGTTWGKARGTLGQPALFLPQSFGALATTLIGLPITLSAEVDEAVPLVGAAARQGHGPIQVAIGIHVKAGDRFVDQVTRGEGARFNATVDPTTHITLLTDKVAPESARVTLGVLGNYVIVAPKPADLYSIGPYVVRTLAVAPPPKDDVAIEMPEAALAGPILDEVRDVRTASEGSAVTLIPLAGMLDTAATLLGDAKGGRCSLSFDAAMVRGRCAVTPKLGGGPGTKLLADLAVGDVKPLLDLPDTTTLALLWRESSAARAENAPKQADALSRLLGGEVTPDDKAAISAALRAEAAARGDWQAVGVAFNGTGPTAVVRAPVTDADQMRKAVRQLVDLASIASFKKALGALGIKLTMEKAVVENLTAEVTRVRLARADDHTPVKGKEPFKPGLAKKLPAAPEGETPKAVDLLYFVDGGGLFAAAGFDPRDSLRALTKSPAGPNLGGIAPFASALGSVGNEATFVLVADVLRINAMTSGGAAPATPNPLVIAAGRGPGGVELWGRFDVPVPVMQQVVQEYVRRRNGAGGAP